MFSVFDWKVMARKNWISRDFKTNFYSFINVVSNAKKSDAYELSYLKLSYNLV